MDSQLTTNSFCVFTLRNTLRIKRLSTITTRILQPFYADKGAAILLTSTAPRQYN